MSIYNYWSCRITGYCAIRYLLFALTGSFKTAMAFWYFDKDELHRTASAQDNIPHETESRYRQEGARFIIDAGTKMDLGYNTMATGVVYFHRFYMYHSFKTFPRYVSFSSLLMLRLYHFIIYF